MAVTLEKDCTKSESGYHCNHGHGWVHTVLVSPGYRHVDEICCHCGKVTCRNEKMPDPIQYGSYVAPKHGPYATSPTVSFNG